MQFLTEISKEAVVFPVLLVCGIWWVYLHSLKAILFTVFFWLVSVVWTLFLSALYMVTGTPVDECCSPSETRGVLKKILLL